MSVRPAPRRCGNFVPLDCFQISGASFLSTGHSLMNFSELRLIAPIQRALAEEQYEEPTPIQAQTIPPALDGQDILGSAQTGTGKTAAFCLPILNRLGKQARKPLPNTPSVLILAPTRELAIQIGDSIATYGRHLRIRHTLVYGGVGQHKQVRDLDRGVHILVATPGRLLDLMGQGYVELHRLEVFVLDEADRMLDMGFMPDLKRIMQELPEERQSLFFSATLPPKIIELSHELLTDPVKIQIEPEKTSVEAIEQQLMFVDSGQKKGLLAKLLKQDGVGLSVVFTKTKRGASNVLKFLSKAGISATEIHGNKSQNARQRALDEFRRGKVQVLVATDVAARGIDVDGITHVFNMDLPIEPECYVHRIGRTGRAGAAGIAISFCSPAERNLLRAIEREIGQKVPLAPNQPKREELRAEFPSDNEPADEPRRSRGRHEQRSGGQDSRRQRPQESRGYDDTRPARDEYRAAGPGGSRKRPSRPNDGGQERPARGEGERRYDNARPARDEYRGAGQGPSRKKPGRSSERGQDRPVRGEGERRYDNPRPARDEYRGAGQGPSRKKANRPSSGGQERPARSEGQQNTRPAAQHDPGRPERDGGQRPGGENRRPRKGPGKRRRQPQAQN